MSTRPGLDLLRPPAHRGPLIAAGAVVLAVGVVLEELRLGDSLAIGLHVLIAGLAAAAILGIGLQAPSGGGRPPAYQSVLIVTGLLLLEVALLRLAEALGADFGSGGSGARETIVWGSLPPGAMVWTSLVLAGVAILAARTRRSAVALLIAALAAGVALLAAMAWIFDADSQGPYRFLLLLLAVALVLGSLVLRGSEPRQAEQLVNAAAVAILVIPLAALAAGALQLLSLFGGAPEFLLPDFWELVVLAAGCGLVAFGAVDRAPGAAWLGFANLLAFVAVVAISPDETLLWWPLILILLGLGAMLAGEIGRASCRERV